MKDGLCIRGMIHDTWLRQHLHHPLQDQTYMFKE
jgi:hypothetical protein